jgi:hypothetical protein
MPAAINCASICSRSSGTYTSRSLPYLGSLISTQEGSYTIEAHSDRTLLYQTGGTPPDAGYAPRPGCTVDAVPANKAQHLPWYLWAGEIAIILLLGATAVAQGKKP